MPLPKAFLILAVATGALTYPLGAHASPEFTMGGKGLTKAETETFEGTFGFTSSAGGLSCPTKAELQMEPGATGNVKSFAVAKTEGCVYSGNLDNLCGVVDEHVATGLPFIAEAKDVSGAYTFRVLSLHLDNGGTGIFCPDVTVSGEIAATPDKAGEISSVTISGTLGSNLGTSVTAVGTLNAGHPKTWGVGDPIDPETFEGILDFTTSAGGVSCLTKAEIELEPGPTGKVESFGVAKTESCVYSGNVDNLCGVVDEHAATGLPWTPHVEKVSGVQTIRIPGSHWHLGGTQIFCPNVTGIGTVAATPDNAGEVSSIAISGTLETNLGTEMVVKGTLNAAHPKTWKVI